MIFEIVNALLPLSSSWKDGDAFALDLAATVVYGVLFFTVASILVYFFLTPRLWNGPDQQVPYGATPRQQPNYSLGSMQLSAQFPGQSIYTEQPQNHIPVPHASSRHMQEAYLYPPVADADYYTKPQAPLQTGPETFKQ